MTRPTRVLWFAAVAIVALGVSIPAGLILMERAERARRATARARAEPWREVAGWKGTNFRDTFGIPAPVLSAFANNPPAPEERKQHFHFLLHPGATTICVGWIANCEDVTENITENADGWEVTVKVSAYLKALRGGIPYTPASTTETWQVSRDGRATFLRCQPGPGYTFLFHD